MGREEGRQRAGKSGQEEGGRWWNLRDQVVGEGGTEMGRGRTEWGSIRPGITLDFLVLGRTTGALFRVREKIPLSQGDLQLIPNQNRTQARPGSLVVPVQSVILYPLIPIQKPDNRF